MMTNTSLRPIRWTPEGLQILDQRALPLAQTWLHCETWPQVADAITQMAVRGAPAIGIVAAYGLAMAARQHGRGSALSAAFERFAQTRPTAVNLFWVLDRLRALLAAQPEAAPYELLLEEAHRIQEEDLQMCRAMGDHGATLLKPDAKLLTHCNTGSLATGGYGTALGVIRSAARMGGLRQVLACETRPYLQGARLTAWELAHDGLPVRVITDSMAGWFMAQGEVDAVLVGADRIGAHGDVANKIGTYALAVLARAHGIPFYVVAPTSTVDLEILSPEAIPIEQRPAQELTHFAGVRIVPEGVGVENPAFDVTPARLITAIITEHGALSAPFSEGLIQHVARAKNAGA